MIHFQHITFIKYVCRCLAAAHWSRVYFLHKVVIIISCEKFAKRWESLNYKIVFSTLANLQNFDYKIFWWFYYFLWSNIFFTCNFIIKLVHSHNQPLFIFINYISGRTLHVWCIMFFFARLFWWSKSFHFWVLFCVWLEYSKTAVEIRFKGNNTFREI